MFKVGVVVSPTVTVTVTGVGVGSAAKVVLKEPVQKGAGKPVPESETSTDQS